MILLLVTSLDSMILPKNQTKRLDSDNQINLSSLIASLDDTSIPDLGILVDSEIVLSTRYGKTRVFINKTLSTETAYQQDLINRDLQSTRLIVGKVGPGMWCGNCNSTCG